MTPSVKDRKNSNLVFADATIDSVKLETGDCRPPHIRESDAMMQRRLGERPGCPIQFVQKLLAETSLLFLG